MAKDRKTGGQASGAASAQDKRAARLREALRENLRKRKPADPGSIDGDEQMLRRADPLRLRGIAIEKPDRRDS
jgi:hypothetical protein